MLDLDGYGPSSCTFSTDIDWGDGSPVQTVTYPGNDAAVGNYHAVLSTTSHTYSAPGVYTITTTTSATSPGLPSCANSGWIGYRLQFTFESRCGVVTESVGHAPAVGTTVEPGQTISTGSDGGLQLTLSDGGYFYLGPDAEVVCDSANTAVNGIDSSVWSWLQGFHVYVSPAGRYDHVNIETPAGSLGFRGCVVTGAVLPGGKLLVHVIQGTGILRVHGKPDFDFPAGEGVLINGNSYRETLRLPPGAASLIPARDRPPSITALRATGAPKQKPVLRFKLSKTAELKIYVRHGKRTILTLTRPGKNATNKLKLSKALAKGSYTVELVAADHGLTSIATAPLLIR